MKPKGLKKGDKVAIVSLSSGILGESFAAHQLALGKERLEAFGLEPVVMPHALEGIEALENHPEWRAEDLKSAFQDTSIKGIICAIGGDDTYRLLPYLMEDQTFLKNVKKHPKVFTGFSDTTINHLMFYKLGMNSFYGPNFLSDVAELDKELLPYAKKVISGFFEGKELEGVLESSWWYEERTDFSVEAIGTKRIRHLETKGIEILQGTRNVSGPLLGGCLESLAECLTGGRYPDQLDIINKYSIFPNLDEWKDKLLFIETSEEKPTPERFKEMILSLKNYGIFSVIKGVLVGKPQDEVEYEVYKEILVEVIDNQDLPIAYNLPFGHAYPRCILPYGVEAEIVIDDRQVIFKEPYFDK
ncbi:S66 family peptidase [Marinilactibacillus kalidii]|uniref:S66 family peptidase n=1 Tax=Marinilactibacillus kalidii TaxID=2820274 RepID=UPI001ABE6B37|nr:S66 peptidase family protein [Marinilactibacillus kalidii]